jgi:hypothetical protein
MTKWQKLLLDLKANGFTQAAIAEECGSTQTTISSIASGVTKDPGYALGAALTRLADPDTALGYEETIQRHGGSSALARKLGIKPNSVSNWKARGINKAWAMAIRSLDPVAPPTASASIVTVVVGGLEVTISVKPVGAAK